MRFWISICLLAIGQAASHPQGYGLPGSFHTLIDDSAEINHLGTGPANYGGGCLPGEVLHIDGTCVTPHITRSIYVYAAPKVPASYIPPPVIPKPRINYNVVFVRTPELPYGLDPIVIPPPQEKTIVYVLTKNGQIGQHVIEVPAGYHHSPEVFYVNYNEGENPVLPGGIHLQEALSSAATHDGQILGGHGIVSEEVGGGFGFNGDFNAGVPDVIGDDDGLIGATGLSGGYGVGVGNAIGVSGIKDGFSGGSVTYVSGQEGSLGGSFSTGLHSKVISGKSDNKINSGLGGFLRPRGRVRPLLKPSKLNVKFK